MSVFNRVNLKAYGLSWLCVVMFPISAQAKNLEPIVLEGYQALEQAQFEKAETKFVSLVQTDSKYKLALLMQAELQAIKAGKLSWIEQNRQNNKKLTDQIFQEAKVRWQKKDNEQRLLSQYVLKQSASQVPYLVIISSQDHRLYLFKNSEIGFKKVADYYISIGRKGAGKEVRGDLKTPIGIYRIVKEISDERLPELYGVAALTLNYPNKWDQKQGRTGSGIWLHGTPRSTYSRAPLASRGCVVLNNPAMQTLIKQYALEKNTPVLIVDSLAKEEGGLVENKTTVLTQINEWLAKQKKYKVDWKEVNVYQYPGEAGLYFVSFVLPGSNKVVEQYWQKEAKADDWQLVIEQTRHTSIVSGSKFKKLSLK